MEVKDLSPGEYQVLVCLDMVGTHVYSKALVGILHLRKLWRGMGGTRAAFDLCLTSLIERGILEAHRHDYTASLSDTEKAGYLTIDGRVYVGVVLKLA